MFMPSFEDRKFGRLYYHNFIAAVPKSDLVSEAMEGLMKLIISGHFP